MNQMEKMEKEKSMIIMMVNYNMKVNFYMEKEVEKEKNIFLIGKLKFEGEYLRGERNGNGTEYYHNGIRRYICEYLNGKKMEKE